ncbi:acyl CoA binding protein-domain-containing protein [Microdochium trichocladiopsis]|uniref:Acyl CoA binding protein-domain-containing protein n=1 Tax=Microdochium trichocladiopsis TaxID=1682393 RepID=A0A9P9BKY2_9PEZI|nr:acyl CoA binding protein-domain-containing protein [Microdochium trichocladiopsis]KAH7021087.1 acyl CoA binding protein-domain-containing protein [Microdochium trichocladiopsis]
MADSVDRVFVHALNTVKKIPKTGASRPPPSDRLRLYGLYKQAMEGDVDGVMERPASGPGVEADELQRERDKWDAWSAQHGLSRTEAKKRYIEALIDTMHRHATTPDARELVSELEFVWNQIKNNTSSPSVSDSSPKASRVGLTRTASEPVAPVTAVVPAPAPQVTRKFQQPTSGTEGPMRILSPMSEDDVVEAQYRREHIEEEPDDGEYVRKGDRWSRKVERALVRMSAEVAALREQITTSREWRTQKEKSWGAWLAWALWRVTKHIAIDISLLCLVLLFLRRRKDRRIEDQVRASLTVLREYARKVLPSR